MGEVRLRVVGVLLGEREGELARTVGGGRHDQRDETHAFRLERWCRGGKRCSRLGDELILGARTLGKTLLRQGKI